MSRAAGKVALSWQEAYDLSLKLADKIKQDCGQRDWQFDALVVVPRGSYYPVNIIAREFGFGAVDLLHACISSYTNEDQREQQFKLGQMPLADDIMGKDLLIIEEVCDTGHTLQFLADRFHAQGAKSVRSGCLHYKPEQSQTGFEPDWYVAETNDWIVYPWEVHEQTDSSLRRR